MKNHDKVGAGFLEIRPSAIKMIFLGKHGQIPRFALSVLNHYEPIA